MSDNAWVWIVLGVVGLAGSALFSGLETGAYSLNRIRLHVLAQRKQKPAITLRSLMSSPEQLLGTLLIGNNLMNYMGTASLTVLLEKQGLIEWQIVVLNAAIVTPMLFVFGETLPKDLFSAYSDTLMYRLAFLLRWSTRAFTWIGLLPVVTLVSHATMKVIGRPGRVAPLHPRRLVEQLLREGVGHGVVTDEQAGMIARVLSLSSRSIADEMIPWKQVRTLFADDPIDVIWEVAETTSLTRFPVIDSDGHVTGVVNVHHALLSGRSSSLQVRDLTQPTMMLSHETPLRAALHTMQSKHAEMAVVTDAHDKPIGVITVKDLIEPITGELTSW